MVMNLNPIGVFALLGGLVLLYSAVKNKYPQDVVREALGKPALLGPITGGTSVGKKLTTDTLPPATGVPVVTV